MALQHLRSSTANKRPTPAAMSDGQLAMNTNLASPGLFLKDSNGSLVKIGPVHVGTAAPNVSPAVGGQAGNSVGEMWLDTTGGLYVLKTWDGTAWRSVSITGDFVDTTGDTMTGALVMDNQGQVRFRETTANGTSYIALQASASVASDKIITLPDATGTVVLSGAIVNADINASAAIVDTKLATISTAGKVSNSATTAASANTASAIVARDGSGNFTAGTITATTFAGSGASLTALNASTLSSGTVAEARLPFQPVQQGGGAGQGTSKVYIGWNGSNLALQVDTTSFGATWPIAINGNANTATTASNVAAQAYGAVGTYTLAKNVQASAVPAGGTIAGSNLRQAAGSTSNIWAASSTSYAGTWRNMGSNNNTNEYSLYTRIA